MNNWNCHYSWRKAPISGAHAVLVSFDWVMVKTASIVKLVIVRIV